ncbi:MAG: V/A-type H+/Na+-transporting ATPase subunit [Thermoplasmata archaeon]|jgi:V/A-type H+-transporting ATPase subunit C|nr:V/A-type H+/Na+-transporting ATPase subunit [Thermoplasmata archaeon]
MAMAALKKGSSNFAYAVARVQAKKAKLIPPSEFEKILKMDVREVTRYVEESAYKTEVDELAPRFSGLDLLEAALTVNEERTYEAVRAMLGGGAGAIVNLFLDRYHYDDVKTLLRGKTSGATRDELLREMVLEDQATYDLFSPLLADDVKTIPDIISALNAQGGQARDWARLLEKVPAGSSLARYDDVLDKAYFDRLLLGLEGSGEKGADAILEFVRREIDAVNLLNAARWVAAGEQGDFSVFVVPGGKHLKIAEAVALSKAKSLSEFGDLLNDSRQFSGLKPAIDTAVASGRLAPFQGAVWHFHLADMDKLAHRNPLSLVPILLFLLRKHHEVRVLRAVARGKAAGLSEDRLRELVL